MIEVIDLYKSFGDNKVLQGINLTIEEGETFAIIGRSGCGKSVLLKHIVGLLEPDSGTVKIEGQDLSQVNENDMYKIRTKFGFLFQGAALFDSLNVEENVGLSLIENDFGFSQKEIDDKVAEKLELVGLPDIQKVKPSELSGGMRKRVGLARALINEPKYILYDEPTTGLDPVMSDSIDELVKELSEKLNVTSIVVTHDMFSVKNVADRIAMIHEGKIYFNGTPNEILTSEDPAVKGFIQRTGF